MPPWGRLLFPPSHSPVNSGELSPNLDSEHYMSSCGDFQFAWDVPRLRTFDYRQPIRSPLGGGNHMRILLSIATRPMRKTAYLFFVLPMLLRPIAAQSPDAYSYQILYTGRTLGYARIPNEQTLPLSSADSSPSPIAKEFLSQFDLASKPGTAQFRIAMGDNFSPDLYGRSIRVPSILVPYVGCPTDVPLESESRPLHIFS